MTSVESDNSLLKKLSYIPKESVLVGDLGGSIPVEEYGCNSRIKRYYISSDELLSIFERVFNNEEEDE
jgi:hypothetical protein